MNARTLIALAFAGAMAAACVTPPPPATLTFAGQNCAERADLTTAISLTPPQPKREFVVSTPISAAAHCLQQGGANRPYVLYALPVQSAGKTLNVGGVLEPARIFPADVSILDAQGGVTRAFTRDQFLYRGGDVYSIEFRPRDGEAFVLVTAEPTLVGRTYNSIAIGTRTTSTGQITWTSGTDDAQSRTFSYEGTVRVSVYDVSTTQTAH